MCRCLPAGPLPLPADVQGVVRRCTATGWVATLAGRRRHLTEIRAAGDGWGNEQQAQVGAAVVRQSSNRYQGGSLDRCMPYVLPSGLTRATASGHGRACLLAWLAA